LTVPGFDPSASPRLRAKIFLGSLLVAIVSIVAARNVLAQARPGTVDITVTSRTPNAVQVEEHYVLGISSPLELRVLTRPCMVIENLIIERDGVALAVAETRKGPWIIWRDTTGHGGDSLLVRYNVWLGGSRTIPLAHLTAPLPGVDSSRQGPVTVSVQFGRGEAQVEFPHMTRQAPKAWSGRYVAAPSFVKVGGPAFVCDRNPPAGDNGGLVWRYWLLLGIMVVWVPIYLSWARRTGDRA